MVVEYCGAHIRGCTCVKKRIDRTANRLFLGYEHRVLQFINSVKNKPKNVYLFYLYFYHFPLIKSE